MKGTTVASPKRYSSGTANGARASVTVLRAAAGEGRAGAAVARAAARGAEAEQGAEGRAKRVGSGQVGAPCVGLAPVEGGAVERGEALQGRQFTGLIERHGVERQSRVGGEDARAAAGALLGAPRVRRAGGGRGKEGQGVWVGGREGKRHAAAGAAAKRQGGSGLSVPRKKRGSPLVAAAATAARCSSRLRMGRQYTCCAAAQAARWWEKMPQQKTRGSGAQRRRGLRQGGGATRCGRRETRTGRTPPTSSALRFSSMCCGVMVAPMRPAGKLRTKSAACPRGAARGAASQRPCPDGCAAVGPAALRRCGAAGAGSGFCLPGCDVLHAEPQTRQ